MIRRRGRLRQCVPRKGEMREAVAPGEFGLEVSRDSDEVRLDRQVRRRGCGFVVAGRGRRIGLILEAGALRW
jgi:hypothetical protein